ncbi:hypothetical protein [Rhodococcus opacus]|nr:hypothetical protein [Rhodococcus opacus]
MSSSTATATTTPKLATSTLLFAAVLAVHTAVSRFIGNNGWDDGAITLAFARTFSETGHIALTPLSEQVEGFSSVAWFLWISVANLALPIGFDGLIAAAQLSASALAAFGAVVLYKLIGSSTNHPAAAVVSGMLFISGAFLNETSNGMEMTLLTVAALILVRLIQTESSLTAVASLAAIVPIIRLEATAYVVAGAAAVFIIGRNRRLAAAIAGGAVLGLVVVTLLRLALFEDLIPNTIVAKQSAPYSPGTLSGRVSLSIGVVKELAYVLAPALILAVLAAATTKMPRMEWVRKARKSVTLPVIFTIGYTVAVAGVNLAMGRNWGYLGRMELSLIPLAAFVVVAMTTGGIGRLGRNTATALAAVAYFAVAVYGVDRANVHERLDPGATLAVTPAEYRETGQAFDAFRQIALLDTVTVLSPDVGGSALCCESLEILDLGLLTNRELAHSGYGPIGSYIESHRPDIIETHGDWSRASRIYTTAAFREGYKPVSVHGIWMYARSDVLQSITSACEYTSAGNLVGDRYRGGSIDEQFISSAGFGEVCTFQ